MDRVIAAALYLQPSQSLIAVGLCHRCLGWSTWGYGGTRRWCDPVDAAAAGSCAERWRFSAEEFISARRSALVEHERKVQKASWLGVEDMHEVCRVDLHPSSAGDTRENFYAVPDDRAVFEYVPSTIPQPKSAWCVLFGGVWRRPLKILRERAKLLSWDCVMLVGLLQAWGNGYCSCWTHVALVLGASKGRRSAPSLNHTCREICVISLATFTITVCRWIASETNLSDGPSRQSVTVQECVLMFLPKQRELPLKKRNLESFRESAPALVLQT